MRSGSSNTDRSAAAAAAIQVHVQVDHTFAGDIEGQPLCRGVTGERHLLIDVVDSRADMTVDDDSRTGVRRRADMTVNDDSRTGVCCCCTHVSVGRLQRRTFQHCTATQAITHSAIVTYLFLFLFLPPGNVACCSLACHLSSVCLSVCRLSVCLSVCL